VTVQRSLIVGNTALNGGGIDVAMGDATISNSTISGNIATDETGGIYNDLGSTSLTIEASTIVGNSTPVGNGSASGVLVGTGGGTKMIHNSIVAGNTGDAQCTGTWTNTAYSIDGDGSCNFDAGAGNQTINPQLGPLADTFPLMS